MLLKDFGALGLSTWVLDLAHFIARIIDPIGATLNSTVRVFDMEGSGESM